MKLHCLMLAGIALLLFSNLNAQTSSPIKFGKVTPADFDLSKQHFDTSVSAVVIADIGTSYFEGNTKGWFTLIHKRQKRVKILTKNGFDAANEEVLLYSKDNDEEKLENLKASTYNLENGMVSEVKLGSDAVFKERISKHLVRMKFTFPAAKEGSLIEFSYTLSSDFLFNLQPWTFQCEYPCLWSEYQVKLPEFFNYVYLSQGYNPFFIKTSVNKFQNYHVSVPGQEALTNTNQVYALSGNETTTRWVIKDVPPLKEEAFTSTLKNHVSKIEFQLSQYRMPNTPVEEIMGNWGTANEKLLKDETFGAAIDQPNNWMDDDLKAITRNAASELEKARLIYAYVRDNFTCTSHNAMYILTPLKSVFKSRNGSVADINLLLVAMLRHAYIQADPVLLSTRENGFAQQVYPLIDRFNYVIATTSIDGKAYYLDASRPSLGFGRLTPDCYNGYAHVIGAKPAAIDFEADSLKEKKMTMVFIINNDNGEMEGTYQSDMGYIESLELRQKVKQKGEADFFKKINSSFSSDISMANTAIDSLKLLDEPVTVHYDFKIDHLNDDIIYFNPLMGERYVENMFTAAERHYPVEMPYAFDKTFVLNMEVPKNYVVDELPKSAKVSLNVTEGLFEYLMSHSGNNIELRCRIAINKANFQPEDYDNLRQFFGYVVKKQSEQIVFKKKKS